ncbi:putative bifunctional diguanylate cyclase/phosphodiesterase [Acidovorax temperans]|uniref:putative bifunctional diguanylate cyclase/phosphodiesterase n=1 Tax=Acidovorax temperans TaxID=80878 RepID=UPI0005C9A274|nr:EAL domain-containing protein [Acidovorax temperans]
MTAPHTQPAGTPHTVRVFNLRLWLPLSLIIASAVMALVLVADQQRHYAQDLQRFADHTAHAELLETQRALETVLRRSDGSGTVGIVSQLGLNPAIAHAALVGPDGKVIAATRFAWKGRTAAEHIPGYPEDAVRQVRRAQRELLTLDRAQLRLTAVAPVTMGLQSGEVRATRQGVLWIDYDLRPIAVENWQQRHTQAVVLAMAVLLGSLGLLALAHWGILRPVAALRAGMERIGAGDFTHLPRLQGSGDFHDLGQALQKMANELQARNTALAESEARFRQLSDASFEAIILHENGRITDANAAADRLMGVAPGGLVGTAMLSWVSPPFLERTIQRTTQGMEGVWEVDLQDAQGQTIPCECSVRRRQLGNRQVRVVAVRDIRTRLAAEAEIRQLAHFNALTGLSNRRSLLEQVVQELAAADLQPRRAALATININAFQSVNDSLGMAAGDTVLRTMARRLSALQSQGQRLARVDGDTFALLLCDLQGDLNQASAEAARTIERLLAVIAEPLEVQGQVLHLSAGAGVVMIPHDSRDAPELLREAETAMHRAKDAGDSRVYFFAHALQEAASERLALRSDLRRALEAKPAPLLLHYQPQVDSHGRLAGVEALVRWQDPRRGLVSPVHFIPEAEASGLIVPLGNWVLEEAATTLHRWQNDPACAPWATKLTMAVNVSARQFREADFIGRIESLIARVGIDAFSLELELTESVLVDDLEATLEKMAQLRRHGVRFALDDFGTGYSSLAYLKRLPIDVLKIDRSFTMDIDAPEHSGQGKRPAVLIDAIVAMAHQLDLRVLAEGVETLAQQERLLRSGCDLFQGYRFSRPLPEAEFRAWAAQQSARLPR